MHDIINKEFLLRNPGVLWTAQRVHAIRGALEGLGEEDLGGEEGGIAQIAHEEEEAVADQKKE